MTVRLTYFRTNGKWYANAQYKTSVKPLYKIWEEVERKMSARCLPGLIPDHSDYLVVVDVPRHTHNHPHLIMPPNFVHVDHQCL